MKLRFAGWKRVSPGFLWALMLFAIFQGCGQCPPLESVPFYEIRSGIYQNFTSHDYGGIGLVTESSEHVVSIDDEKETVSIVMKLKDGRSMRVLYEAEPEAN